MTLGQFEGDVNLIVNKFWSRARLAKTEEEVRLELSLVLGRKGELTELVKSVAVDFSYEERQVVLAKMSDAVGELHGIANDLIRAL